MPDPLRLTETAPDRAKPMKVAFTTERLRALKPPKEGRRWVYDAKSPLAVMLTSAGAAAFYVYRKVNGRPVRFRIGGVADLPLDEARRRAVEVIADALKGIDGNARKKAARADRTFNEVFTDYLENHAKVHKKTWREDQHKYDAYLTTWASRKAKDITQADVAAMHTRIGKGGIERKDPKGKVKIYGGKGAADRTLEVISAIFNFAGRRHDNPTQGIKRFGTAERERFITATEFPEFIKAVNAEPPLLRDFFMMALWTGQRRANVQGMAWAEIDLEAKTWTIPASKMKAGKPITVALVDQAVAILKERKAENDKLPEPHPYVFPSHRAIGVGKCPHLSEPKTAWRRILKRAKLADLRIHDIRRTAGSWMAAGGTSLHVIGKALGHRRVQTTAIYSRLNLDPVREAVQAAAAAMEAASKVEGEKK